MDSSVSPKDEIWFLRVCHHISTGLYKLVGGPAMSVRNWTAALRTPSLPSASKPWTDPAERSASLGYQASVLAQNTPSSETLHSAGCSSFIDFLVQPVGPTLHTQLVHFSSAVWRLKFWTYVYRNVVKRTLINAEYKVRGANTTVCVYQLGTQLF